MKKTPLEIITKLSEEAKAFPNAVIEYSFDLPKAKGITSTSFFGVKAVYNRNVPKETGATITYKLS